MPVNPLEDQDPLKNGKGEILMKDMLEKTLLAGFGALVLTKEKAKGLMDELTKKGEMSQADAKEFIDSLIKKGEEEQEKIRTSIKEDVKKSLEDLGTPSREEFENLKKRVEALENRHEQDEALYTEI